MAGLFDQYAEATSRPPVQQSARPSVPQPITSGYISATLEDEAPIFSKKRIMFEPPGLISHMCASNNYLVIAVSSNILLRIDVDHLDRKDEVEMPRGREDDIAKLFLDPTGRHVIICMKSRESYYLSRGSKKPKPLTKLKGMQITAIGWNKYNVTDTTTGEILIGTKQGVIVETEISLSEDGRFFQSSLEKYIKQVSALVSDKPYPITNIEIVRTSQEMTGNKYFIMVTLPGRLYQFLGTVPPSAEGPIFADIFTAHEGSTLPRSFLELPGNFGDSKLQFYYPAPRQIPKSFAWMTGPGILTGDIDVTGVAGNDSVIMDKKLVPYLYEEGEQPTLPVDVVLTEFHILAAFKNRLKAICVLNEKLVHDDVYPERFGHILGMIKDPMKSHIWTYTCKAVFRHSIYHESRDVWQMYLDMNLFDKAIQFCKDNPVKTDKVLTAKAQYLFKQQRYEESALVYALTQASFEEITLRFIRLEQKEALKAFLLKKLMGLRSQDKTQMTMMSTWLVELFLNQLGELRETQNSDPSATPRLNKLKEDFRKFLENPKIRECLNSHREMIYELISSHGDVEHMVLFAMLMRDYERVINHYLQHDEHVKALEVLRAETPKSDIELFYKFSPQLMQKVPGATVEAWKSCRGKLQPKRLIPALVQYDQQHSAQENAAIDYLEFCVKRLENKDEAIHNYLLSLYAKHKPDKLLDYLEFQGHDAESICYDVKYALRLCSEHKHQEACVHIYSIMGLYEEAVDLAIEVDINLAKRNADKPEDDAELKKKLWLKIARHVVEKEKNIKQAMEFLHECDLLKIEDVLPFFPDFVTIDHFKDAICTSLQEYNKHIDSLKEEMNEATESARHIRADIQSFRNKFACVKAQDKCSGCDYPLMTRAFYVFPCQHRFHSDCLIDLVLPHLTEYKRKKVAELQRHLSSNEGTPRHVSRLDSASQYPGAALERQLSQRNVKEELDEIVAGECFYCGDMMIRLIDKSFLDDNIFESSESWL